ncbi:hypothetical protein C5S36_10980 [Candidatus Methanophagaceae archaeon]|jgi:hypothetical protein|nr:hypothetical protein C5S36_10980 [Methanophagales archaeon]
MLKLKEKRKGVEGLSRPFKEFLLEDELNEGDQIVYYGRPALCVPYIMVKSYEIRNLPVQQVFVPLLDESKAKVIKFVPDVGMQVSEEVTEVHPQVVVLMGGLTMPDVHISAEKALDHVSRYEPKIVGACYMSELFDTKWPDVIPFDLLVDGIIDPVYVWRKTD